MITIAYEADTNSAAGSGARLTSPRRRIAAAGAPGTVIRRFAGVAAAAALLAAALPAWAQISDPTGECGSLKNAYGPFDRRTATTAELSDVEVQHFGPAIESLSPSVSTLALAQNLAYTLRVFPNHARALDALSKLSVRTKRERLPGAGFSTECFFERAMRFRPEDPAVHLTYGLHLMRLDRMREAVVALERAKQLGPDDPNIDYNLGLAYFDLQDYDRALEHAQLAYERGWPLEGLRNRLVKAGKWKPGN
jgi:tetratricopeptide (TPR) repeat protein